jgi:hypothetical protein
MVNSPFVSLTLVQLRSRGFLVSRSNFELSRLLCLFCLVVFPAPLLLCSPAVVYAQPDSTYEVYEYVMQWGTSGSDTGQFNGPGGMCIDDSGYIYVCDFYNYRIQKFDRTGHFILTWGHQGTGPGEFEGTYDVTADHHGRIYVNDAWSYRIEKFDNRGNFILQWTDTAAGLDCGPSNRLYIGGCGSSPYESLGVYDTLGNRIASWGNPFGDQYWFQYGVGVDDSENVYVVKDPSNPYIIKFDSTGRFLLKWGGPGTANGHFAEVPTIRTGDGCRVFTPDRPMIIQNFRVQKFASDSTFITTWGRQGNGNGEFQGPFSAVVDKEGFVYVSDGPTDRIQKFKKTIVGVAAQGRNSTGEGSLLSIKCFPDPVRTVAVLKFALPPRSDARLNLYNAAGQKVRRFGVNPGRANIREIGWDGRDENGHLVPSGVYFITLESNSGLGTSRITVIR